AVGEPAGALHELEELLLADAPDGVGLAPLSRRLEERCLDLVERVGHGARESVELERRLASRPPRGHHLPRRDVARTNLEPQRHALRLPLEVLGAGLHVVTQIELHTDARLLELLFRSE